MNGPKFRPSDPVDFLVIGAGAAGGVMAKELATAGFRVVVLEQGPYWREKDYSHDEIKYTFLPGLTNDVKLQPITYRAHENEPAQLMKAIEYGRQVVGDPYTSPLITGVSMKAIFTSAVCMARFQARPLRTGRSRMRI